VYTVRGNEQVKRLQLSVPSMQHHLYPCFEIYHTRLHYDRSDSDVTSSTEDEVVESETDDLARKCTFLTYSFFLLHSIYLYFSVFFLETYTTGINGIGFKSFTVMIFL